ncbi:MAG: Asp-tRNA(Asn)/Glu-tRNA(Gln) amidotransferase subunit GatC [Planctomycetes bacterium]|nr:Asp-tRNA(Asn)/Glu-tRNA(Gln) amidotransferase subunit GatC [Planctomycetota bacterium]
MTDQLNYNIDTKKIAFLSRISLPDEESETMSAKFTSILGAFQTIQGVEVKSAHELQKARVRDDLRLDVAHTSLGEGGALDNAPQAFKGHFRVPAVL